MRKFFWGTAVAAYQVEGGIENNDWAEAGRNGRVPPAGKACDFWNRYEAYLDLAKELGTNAFRFSIEWARIEPREDEWNEAALGHYSRMLEAMRERGLEPFVTLWHFTLPQWVAEAGGWANPRVIERFVRYVQRVAETFGKGVRYWIVINEPSVVLGQGYLRGIWPPGRKFALRKYFRARSNVKRAVLEASRVLHAEIPGCVVGSAFNLAVIEPARSWDPADRFATWLTRRFDDREFIASVYRSLDFIGLNYYMRLRLRAYLLPFPTVKPWVPSGKAVSDIEWEIFPEGLTAILLELRSRFGLPVIVTENGVADARDELRSEFIRRHVMALEAAERLGADVRGYFHWSLIDNFEWAYGFGPRFGLYEMDYASLEARARKSAAIYAELIRSR